MQLTFEGDTLREITAKIRDFLAETSYDAEGALAALHQDIPDSEVVRSNPKPKHGGKPSKAAVEAAMDAEAPPCSREDVADALRGYIAVVGEEAAARNAHSLMGAATLSSIPEAKLWRARAALLKAVDDVIHS